MNKPKNAPRISTPIPPELIKELAVLFPNRCPSLTTPDRQVWHAAGAAHVVTFLQMVLKEQQEAGSVLNR